MTRPDCEMCSKPFSPTGLRGHSTRFCSRNCRLSWIAKNRRTTKGYIITLKGYKALYWPDHPDSAKNGYIMEHRVVMEKVLGRRLLPGEVVNHKNWDKLDNRPENLEVLEKREHDRLPKPPGKPIECPHCGGKIKLSGRSAKATKLTTQPTVENKV